MNIVRSDFQVVWEDDGWKVGRQTSLVGVEEVIFARQCTCGRMLVGEPDFFGRRLTCKLHCGDELIFHLVGCGRAWEIPMVVHERAEQLQRRLHDDAWRIRAEGGGSRQWIPDC